MPRRYFLPVLFTDKNKVTMELVLQVAGEIPNLIACDEGTKKSSYHHKGMLVARAMLLISTGLFKIGYAGKDLEAHNTIMQAVLPYKKPLEDFFKARCKTFPPEAMTEDLARQFPEGVRLTPVGIGNFLLMYRTWYGGKGMTLGTLGESLALCALRGATGESVFGNVHAGRLVSVATPKVAEVNRKRVWGNIIDVTFSTPAVYSRFGPILEEKRRERARRRIRGMKKAMTTTKRG